MAVYPIAQPGNMSALRHPITDEYIVPKVGQPYEEDDPFVQAHRWAFGTSDDAEAAARRASEPVTSVVIESATARPGEKRSTRGRR